MNMICPSCEQERTEKDFFGKDSCYKCVYKQKLSVIVIVKKTCKRCSKDIPEGRRKFCSNLCEKVADAQRNRNYWFRNIQIYMDPWR